MVNSKINKALKVFVFSVFLILLFPMIFQPGLFMDGLMYASVAKNLANGTGTFWSPQFSTTLFPSFHQHPPLVFGLLSVFFKIFGNDFFIEKIYSFLTGILTASFIIFIWRKITKEKTIQDMYWVPVLFWITIPRVYWAFNNNMLENTMGLFSLVAVYLLLISENQNQIRSFLLILIAAILLLLSFLSKGFPGLYPLGFYFCCWVSGRCRFNTMVLKTALILLLTTTIFFLLFFISRDSFQSITSYFKIQLIYSFSEYHQEDARLGMLYDIFQQLIICLSFCLLIIMIYYRKVFRIFKEGKMDIQLFLMMLFIAFSASLPLLISPKLYAYYLVPSMPFFAISISVLMAEILHEIVLKSKIFQSVANGIEIAGYVIILVSLLAGYINYGKCCRDEKIIGDVLKTGNIVGTSSVIGISRTFENSWNIHGYFQRYYGISLDCNPNHDYILTDKDTGSIDKYEPVAISLSEFRLFRKTRSPL